LRGDGCLKQALWSVSWLIVWGKLVYSSVLLPSEWWAPGESIKHWMWSAFDVFRAILVYPHIFSATLASLLLLIAPLPLLRATWRFLFLLVLNAMLTTLALADIIHVRFYADVASVADLVMLPVLKSLVLNIVKALQSTDALYYVDIIISCAIFPFYVRACKRILPLDRRDRARTSIKLAVCGLILATPTAWFVWQNKNELFSYTSLRIEVASTLGILPYHLSNIVIHFATTRPKIDATARERVRHFLTNKYQRNASPSRLTGIARGRNVIVISAESLQAFPIGLEVNRQPIAPRLSAFARESLHFVNFYDQTHLGTTSDAEIMAMQSLHPLPVGVLASNFHHNYFRGLPKILSEHGYTTLSACAAPSSFWNMDQIHPRVGFQKSYFEESYNIFERINRWLSDREFFAQSIRILKEQREPFMAFLLSASNHHPYQLPERYRELDLGELEGTLLGEYLHSVHYFDQAFGEFVDKLRDTGLLDKSVILVYGDHQGFLGDPPQLTRLLGFSERDKFRTLQVRKNVPLLIRLPYKQEAGVRAVAGGHLDIAPTLLSLLGITDDKNVMLGSDLTKEQDSLVVFRDGSFIDGKSYFLNRLGAVSARTCYEVKTGQIIDCEPLKASRRMAVEQLEVSDIIVRADLIPDLTDRKGKVPMQPR
jgi:lipoteichoic acid synthase